ncbi:NERD domain-containing protein [Clostridium estertheticum]|uniref:NERD domain-containing protein n=1 Tax=Clostridium estertheticum TaxID=238834 RepID=UPI001CF4FF69|nr:NERD domain-containing protein [Clostridium estertheticum]MCB2339080.1 NERD domain-containing protein [Clostridium estertheticum]
MEMLFELSTKFWYLWLLIIAAGVLEVYMPKIKGAIGEKSVAFFLSGLDKTKYKLINNIMLSVGNKTTQIDHVIVSNYGIFVIETKNYKGWIVGNEFDDNWKQVIYKHKEKLHNPIKQNYGHIQALKEVLNDFKDIKYISIIAFTTRAEVKVKSKTDVVYTINLSKTIKKYNIENITDLVKEDVYKKLISLNVDSKETRKTHVKAIHKTLAEKDIKVNSGFCPKCGGKLVLRNGRYGQFKGCGNFPRCRFISK